MSSFDKREFDRLVSQLCDQTIDGDAIELLERLVVEHPEALERYTEFMAMHAQLEIRQLQTLPPPEVGSSTDNPVCNIVAAESEDAGSTASITPASPARFPSVRSVAWAAFAAAACVALLLFVPGRGDPGRDHVGVLTEAQGVTWQDGTFRNTPMPVLAGQRLQLVDGIAEVSLSSGVVVVMRGPAGIELVSPMRVRAHHGVVRARVGEDARGFVIETPTTQVVDLGTEFGVDVNEVSGETDVVVFDGAVDLQYVGVDKKSGRPSKRGTTRPYGTREDLKRLTSGEALHVDNQGAFHRIVSIRSEHFPDQASRNFLVGTREPVIRGISDNIRDAETTAYYQIVSGGLREDARAYVDRYHEWNGITPEGIPEPLLGADYVMTFNSDKWKSDIEITVDLACPARLYVFFDDRLDVPDWLAERFTKTDLRIGVDEGFNRPNYRLENGLGPGKSVDTVYLVWQLDVPHPEPVKLGALPTQELTVSMYGIAASPLPSTERGRTRLSLLSLGAGSRPFSVNSDRLVLPTKDPARGPFVSRSPLF